MRCPPWLLGLARQVRLQNAMIVLCAVLVSAYGASMYASLHRAHRQALDDAAGTLESIARSAEVGTNRSIFEIDAALLGVERMLDVMLPDKPLTDRSVRVLLNQANDQTLVLRELLIVGADGRLVNKSGSTAGPAQDLSDRPWFVAHQSGGLPSLFIGRPQRSRATGGWSIMVSRPLLHRDAIAGVIAAEVPITVFTDFYGAVVANSGVRVRLLLDDGSVIASEPHEEEMIGNRAADVDLVLATAAKSRFGVLGNTPDQASASRVVAFARIPARPLILTASRERGAILGQWRSECESSLIAFVLFAVTAGTLTWMMVHAIDRQQRAAAELRAGEARLKRESDLLQSTLENMGEGLSVFDRHGRLVAWNSRFVEMLELPDLSAETALTDILAVQAARGDFGSVDLALAVPERAERFFRNVPYVGERRTLAGRTLQIRRRGMPDGMVVSLYSDVTERKAAELKMAQAWAQAELANRAKGDFLANMSHELRTPLNAIIGFSEILAGEHLGPLENLRYLEYSNDIHSSGLHLLSIINDVLDMSKIEAGKLDIHEEEIAVEPLLAGSVRMVRERARKQRLELVCEVADAEHTIFVDERAMKQCLLNLLSNAIKFSRIGGTVSVVAGIDAQGRTVLTIADEGIGMSGEELERAMQPFGQAHSSTTRTYGGTGLGLPITRGLVEAHGGTLVIDSRPGQGTRVSITLPAARTRPAPARQVAMQA